MKTKPSPIKDVFKSMNINQPYKLSKTAPVFTPPKEVAHFEPPPKEETQLERLQKLVPSLEASQNREPQIEVPKKELGVSEVPQKKHAHTKLFQNEVAKKELPQSEPPQKEATHNGGFFKLAHSVFADKKLQGVSGDCFRLFLWLSSKAWRFSTSDGTVRASVSHIESETGMSHASISRGLKTLKELHLIRLIKLDYKLGNTWEVSKIALGTSPIDPDKKLPHPEQDPTSELESHSLKLSGVLPQNEAQNKNIKNYKELSQAEKELFGKIDAIESKSKQKKERKALVSLLQQNSASEITEAYNFIKTNGVLVDQSICYLPFSYLNVAIEDVLKAIEKGRSKVRKIVMPTAPNHSEEVAGSILNEFRTCVDQETQEKMIDSYLDQNRTAAFVPSRNIVRILIASNWAQSKTSHKHKSIAA